MIIASTLVLAFAACAFLLPHAVLAGESGGGAASLQPVASFEGGSRYLAGTYPVVVLNGSFREMGRQYGALMKTELQGEYAFLLKNISDQGYTQEQVRAMGREVLVFPSQRMNEIFTGMAETSGLTVDDVWVLYNGGILYLSAPGALSSCSFLAAWGNYTPDGTLVLSRNWDLPDAFSSFNQYYALVVYRPSDGSNGVATFGPAGMRPETLMNSKGLFIADDNGITSGGSLIMDNRPDIISEFFRFMLDYSDQRSLDAGIQATRPNCAWIVNVAGPGEAYVYEETVFDTRRRTGNGVIAASNHFVDPSWNFMGVPDENSLVRYSNLMRQAGEAKGTINAGKMMQIRNVAIEEGGATFRHTLLSGHQYSTNHQVVFVPKTRTLWMRAMERDWQQVELGPLFGPV